MKIKKRNERVKEGFIFKSAQLCAALQETLFFKQGEKRIDLNRRFSRKGVDKKVCMFRAAAPIFAGRISILSGFCGLCWLGPIPIINRLAGEPQE